MLKLQKQQSCVCESLFKQITLEAGLQVTKSWKLINVEETSDHTGQILNIIGLFVKHTPCLQRGTHASLPDSPLYSGSLYGSESLEA